jgi:hypothetical protein
MISSKFTSLPHLSNYRNSASFFVFKYEAFLQSLQCSTVFGSPFHLLVSGSSSSDGRQVVEIQVLPDYLPAKTT